MRFVPVVFLVMLFFGLCGCRKDRNNDEGKISIERDVKGDSVEVFPQTPDQVLYEIDGNIAYVVIERFYGGERVSGERDSVSFTEDGFVSGIVSWAGSGRERVRSRDIHLFYSSDGVFERGDDAVSGQPVWIERNDSLQIEKFGIGSGESAVWLEEYVWEGLLPVRKIEISNEYDVTERNEYEGDCRSPVRKMRKITDIDGVVQEDCDIEYLQRDDRGNWTERRVRVRVKMYGYDVNTGNVVEEGKKRVSSYSERRHICYRNPGNSAGN